MATSESLGNSAAISKADYLKRYLSNDGDVQKSKEKKLRKKRIKATGRGMKIVDDDLDWRQLAVNEEKENKDEDDEEAPVVAEVIDERPDEIKQLEAFRTSSKWKVMGGSIGNVVLFFGNRRGQRGSLENSPVRRARHDSPDLSPQRRVCHKSPDISAPRDKPDPKHRRHDSSSPSPPRTSANSFPSKTERHLRDSSEREKYKSSSGGQVPDPDLSPPRRCVRRGSDSDLSPPRKRAQGGRGSDSDLSPPRKKRQGGHGSDSDLSPPRRACTVAAQAGPCMLSGGAAGLVSVETLRKEQEEIRRKEKHNQPLEEASRHAETVFRDKTGKKRDLESERAEQSRKAGEKAEKDEKYAQWGKGLAQSQMQQQNVVDAVREAQKPLARHIDDEDLDRMLREQERDGDPMAALLRKKKEKSSKTKEVKERPRYRGPPPPPNRFNIMPGYRWDGVDRSNGFEQKRYSRMADKKAVQEEAYKWSVEDM
uniref:BUD13 homolog n=1 Tax=Electrophorus electricus TaxID=8005 RepID=A0A4W4E8C0_ELEEL